MACKKYTITNNTNKVGVFSYQECSDLIFITQSEIIPGQTKHVWAVDGTFRSTEISELTIVSTVFPSTPPPTRTVTPTPSLSFGSTPTPTPTQSLTSTQTPTPSVTDTPTQTPTPTITDTPTQTPTPTITDTPTQTPTPTITDTPTQTPTPSSTTAPLVQGFHFTLQEVGPDVVLSGTGTADLSSLILDGPYLAGIPFIYPSQGYFNVGSSVNEEYYSGSTLISPTSFGSGTLTSADSSTGDVFGFNGFGKILVPQGYSGGLLNGTATFTGTTLTTLGTVVGTYVTQWGSSGASETITFDVI